MSSYPTGRTVPTVSRVLAAICLIAPLVALLWVPSYAREQPTLGGMPFFYWYPLMWVPVSVVLMLIAHLLLRRGSHR